MLGAAGVGAAAVSGGEAGLPVGAAGEVDAPEVGSETGVRVGVGSTAEAPANGEAGAAVWALPCSRSQPNPIRRPAPATTTTSAITHANARPPKALLSLTTRSEFYSITGGTAPINALGSGDGACAANPPPPILAPRTRSSAG